MMRKHLVAGRAAVLLALIGFGLAPAAHAGHITINNGVVGDGFWSINVLDGGETRTGTLNPAGPIGATDVIFDYFHYFDVGANGGGVRLSSSTITTPHFLSGANAITSAGTFAGANGPIGWTTVSSIAPGSPLYLTTLTLTSSDPFGSLRIIQYLDEDVLGVSDDHLIVIGTPGAADFQLLTIDDLDNVGVSHAATYLSATNMAYVGWAADEFADLRSLITGAGAAYSIPGVVDTTSLPVIVGGDPRFPGLPAFGPEDITSAITFDLDPSATFASVIFSLGGSPTGAPPPPPTGGGGQPGVIPEPSSLLLFGLGGVAAASRRRRRGRRAGS